MTYAAPPDSTWSKAQRATYYLAIGYSALRVAELFGIAVGHAHAIKIGVVPEARSNEVPA